MKADDKIIPINSLDILLFLVFLVLKLYGAITWSWWWVCAPLLIPIALGIVVYTTVFVVFGIGYLYTTIHDWLVYR